jgi:hypothetical protein
MDDSLYSRPNKPKQILVRKRSGAPAMALTELPQAVEIDNATECHVTPPDVAARMVDYLGPVGDFLTLEPSAGTGNLLAAPRAVQGHTLALRGETEHRPNAAVFFGVRRRMGGQGRLPPYYYESTL